MLISLAAWILAFIVAMTVHEAAHAWMSDRLGDPTARLMGRKTLNPLAHYDTIGTTMLFVLVILRALGAPVIPFGWAKPVRYDPFNLRNPRKDAALIALSGPISNLTVVLVLGIILRLVLLVISPFSFFFTLIPAFLIPIIILNVSLALFNLIPIHPLDGGKVLIGLLPEKDAIEAEQFMNRYGIIILFLLIFPLFRGTAPVFTVLSPVIDFILGLIIPGRSIA